MPLASSQASVSAVESLATGTLKTVPLRGADEVGVAPVGHRVGRDDRLGAGRIGGAQHGAEVARLLDALAEHGQRARARRSARRTRRTTEGTTAMKPSGPSR